MPWSRRSEPIRHGYRSSAATSRNSRAGNPTSDARFIARHCLVAEFGLVGATMHGANERVPVEDVRHLARIYGAVLAAFA